jgi:hypothetical protein
MIAVATDRKMSIMCEQLSHDTGHGLLPTTDEVVPRCDKNLHFGGNYGVRGGGETSLKLKPEPFPLELKTKLKIHALIIVYFKQIIPHAETCNLYQYTGKIFR